jgi:hypothetical protein
VHLAARDNVFHLTGNAIGLQINQAVVSIIRHNLFVGDTTPGSTGVDIMTGSQIPVSLQLTSNRSTDFQLGLVVEPAVPPGGSAAQSITAQQNCIEGNASYGAENTTTIQLQAADNWWGAASRPFDPIGNPGGTGNAVFGPITYKPFLTAPAATCP